MRSFASDNNSGVHPAVMEQLQRVNVDHVIGYGDDLYTERAIALLQKEFGAESDIYFVFNGTGANVLGLKAIISSYHSILCAETAHLNVDECGAPEQYTGCKLQTVATEEGKLTVEPLKRFLHSVGFQHHVQPRVISISQVTELGTVYKPAEIAKLASFAHQHGLYLHMDGARLANAAASLGVSLRELTADVGVDVLSFGGTKNGLMYGEAVIFFDKKLSSTFKFIRKQGMQLASKMRFVAAQFEALFTDQLWLKNAQHANLMAQKLAVKIAEIPEITLARPVEANSLYAILPPQLIAPLQKEYFFYIWNKAQSEVRWITSFDTTEEDLGCFVNTIKLQLNPQ